MAARKTLSASWAAVWKTYKIKTKKSMKLTSSYHSYWGCNTWYTTFYNPDFLSLRPYGIFLLYTLEKDIATNTSSMRFLWRQRDPIRTGLKCYKWSSLIVISLTNKEKAKWYGKLRGLRYPSSVFRNESKINLSGVHRVDYSLLNKHAGNEWTNSDGYGNEPLRPPQQWAGPDSRAPAPSCTGRACLFGP